MSISFSPSQKSITECLNPEELKDQISDVLKQKKKILILGKEVVNKLDNKIKKEKLILQLRKDCKYYEEEEKNKIKNLKEITLSKENCEKNNIIAQDFYKNIKKHLGEFGKVIDDFEKKIEEINQEKNDIYYSSYSILEKKIDEKNLLEKKNEEINSKIQNQLAIIDDLNKRFENFKVQKENEEKVFIEQETKDVDKYNKLFKRYRELLTKYNIYEKEENENDDDEFAKSRKIYEDNLAKEDLRVKLEEAKQKNINLKKNLEDIISKVDSISKDESILIHPLPSNFKKNTNKVNISSTINTTTVGYKDLTSP